MRRATSSYMAIAFRRSIRQAIAFVAAGAAAFFTWQGCLQMKVFSAFQGENYLCIAAGVGAFFVGFYVANMLLKSKAAR